jgi:hypothetical protein
VIPGGWFPDLDAKWHWRHHNLQQSVCGIHCISRGHVFYPEEVSTTDLCPKCREAFREALMNTQPRIERFIADYRRVWKETVP